MPYGNTSTWVTLFQGMAACSLIAPSHYLRADVQEMLEDVNHQNMHENYTLKSQLHFPGANVLNTKKMFNIKSIQRKQKMMKSNFMIF